MGARPNSDPTRSMIAVVNSAMDRVGRTQSRAREPVDQRALRDRAGEAVVGGGQRGGVHACK